MRNIYIQTVSDDESSSEVVRWLNYYGHTDCLIEINDFYDIEFVKLLVSDNDVIVDFNQHTVSEKDKYWYRRGMLNFFTQCKSEYPSVNTYLWNKHVAPVKTFLESLNFTSNINCASDNFLEKMNVLYNCKHLGINIPATLVTSSKSDLEEFAKKFGKIITKSTVAPLGNAIINGKEYRFSSSTVLLNDYKIAKLPASFVPSLFQEYIEKKYEIRSFFLDDKIYSMAIFSQNNKKTQVDFRNYDSDNPNRNVPYKLPLWYEKKLLKLYRQLKLTSGSADIIVTPDYQYVFLEVNPIGQFGWLSRNCNYHLEKTIADYLLK